MSNDDFLVNYFSQYATLSEEEVAIIRDENIIREYNKNDTLLTEGQYAKECYLVLKGCVRSYYIKDGVENIMEFYTGNDPITPVSYTNKKPSEYFLSCVEPCIISASTTERTQQFLERHPRFAHIFMQIGDKVLAEKQASFDEFKNSTPEARYQKLINTRPDLINRVPLFMIASYLGVKPESLSRIRKRIWSDKHNT